MPSMTPMMSSILRELVRIDAIVCTTSATTSPPLTAIAEADSTSSLASAA
ncbi:hypothetical protein [Massilia sp. AB1]